MLWVEQRKRTHLLELRGNREELYVCMMYFAEMRKLLDGFYSDAPNKTCHSVSYL